MKRISIYLADDHTLMLEGMGSLIESIAELELTGKFSNGNALLEALDKNSPAPDVILMDIAMPGMDGIETVKAIRKTSSGVKIIALTMHHENHFISKMIAAGADAYVLKNVDREMFVNSIKKVMSGKEFFVEGVSYQGDLKLPEILSVREVEILKEIVKGKSNKEIGSQFYISDRTVDTHRTNIKRKLQLTTLAQLMEYAKSNGIQ
jgi:DNA-binding NarL/FixJ family response regulator